MTHAFGLLIVVGLFVAEVGIPVAIVFHLGRKFERRRIEQAFAEKAAGLTEAAGFPRTRR